MEQYFRLNKMGSGSSKMILDELPDQGSAGEHQLVVHLLNYGTASVLFGNR